VIGGKTKADSIWVQERRKRQANALALISDAKNRAIFDEKYFTALYEQKRAVMASENKTTNTQRVVLLLLLHGCCKRQRKCPEGVAD
jgi:hypothetical protein